MEEVSLRVTSVGLGRELSVDRGSRDGVEAKDRVRFRTRDGRVLWASVLRVEDRSATVELRSPGPPPATGTRGVVLIPSARFEDKAPVVPRATRVKAEPEVSEEHDPWAYVEEGWTDDMPLLAGVGILRPEKRPWAYSGRAYLIGDWLGGSESNRSDAFVRLGASATFENPFNYGGVLNYEGEHNVRRTSVPDEVDGDEAFSDFRLDRLSYAWGGTRFESQRFEFGRFLHDGLPEFGVLDGFEWSERRESGARYGASIGFLPEPIAQGNSRVDFGLSVWYGWSADETETTAVRGGYQKTFNDGDEDRDLLILKAHHLPSDGWNMQGTLWVDRYGNEDVVNDSGFELTRAFLSAGHRWEDGDGLSLTYTRDRFPEILREEGFEVTPDALADDHDERLGASGWTYLENGYRLRSRAGVWRDQDDDGFDVDIGLEVPDLGLDHSQTSFTVFANDAKFERLFGLRLGYGRSSGGGRWDVFYEWSNIHQIGFLDDVDDSIQHRLHAQKTFLAYGGLSVSVYGTLILQDIEDSYRTGLYLQWSF